MTRTVFGASSSIGGHTTALPRGGGWRPPRREKANSIAGWRPSPARWRCWESCRSPPCTWRSPRSGATRTVARKACGALSIRPGDSTSTKFCPPVVKSTLRKLAMRPSICGPARSGSCVSPIFRPVPWAMAWSSEISVGPRIVGGPPLALGDHGAVRRRGGIGDAAVAVQRPFGVAARPWPCADGTPFSAVIRPRIIGVRL